MATRERALDRGTARGIEQARTIGREVRIARRGAGLSLSAVAQHAHLSASELSRVERGTVRGVGLVTLARICAIVGLDLAARAYPSGSPMRDSRHAALLGRFQTLLHPSLRFSVEVPLPIRGDLRAWDGLVAGSGWRYGVEAETNPSDGQALTRRLGLKRRDGLVDGVILLVPDTRQTRAFRSEYRSLLANDYPIPPETARRRLTMGQDPGGGALLVLRVRRAEAHSLGRS